MESGKDDMSEVTHRVKVLEREVAKLRRGSGVLEREVAKLRRGSGDNLMSKTRRRKDGRLESESLSRLRKRLKEMRALDLALALERSDDESMDNTRKNSVFSMVGYLSRCVKVDAALGMNAKWPDLDCALRDERKRTSDGGWWEELCHRELLGQLESFGISKEQWECSLEFWTDETGLYGAPPSDVPQEVGRLREMLHSEDARQLLSIAQTKTFEKILEGIEARKFFFV